MQDQFVPYGIAIALKEIGYPEACMAHFSISLTECVNEEDGKSGPFGWEKGEVTFDKSYFINNYDGIDFSNDDWLSVAAPLYQQAFEWFRINHNYIHRIDMPYNSAHVIEPATKEEAEKFGTAPKLEMILCDSDTYKEAQDACLLKMIEFVKEKS